MSHPKPPYLLWMSLSALSVLVGMGLLLYELVTGVFFRNVPSYVLWAIYLCLLFLSVWGMKNWLELQSETLSWFQQKKTSPQKKRRKVQSHNLFRLPVEGQIYVLMLTIMLLGALFGKTNTLMLIFALMAGPFIVNGGITFGITRRLELERTLPKRIMQGESVSIDITLINLKRFISSSLVAVEDQIAGPRELLLGKLMFAFVPAKSSRTGRYQVRFMQRGRYRFGPAQITSRFPLGIVERGRQLETYDELLVYPRIGQLARWWVRRLTDGQEASRTAMGQSGAHHDEFHRIREYRQGDELRSIHWKTSARKNELMIREYRQNRDRRLLIVVDLWNPLRDNVSNNHANTSRQQRVELAVSLATTIGWNHIQQCGSQNVELLCVGKEHWEWQGRFNKDQPETYLDQLAMAEAGEKISYKHLEQEIYQRLLANTRTLFITTRNTEEFDQAFQAIPAHSETNLVWQSVLQIEADPLKTQEFFEVELPG